MDLRAGLDGCVKSRPTTGIRFPDLPACSESPYRLKYPGLCFSHLANLKLHLSVLHSIYLHFHNNRYLIKTHFVSNVSSDRSLTDGANAVSASRRSASSRTSQSAHVLSVRMFYGAENMGSGVLLFMSSALRYMMTIKVRNLIVNVTKIRAVPR